MDKIVFRPRQVRLFLILLLAFAVPLTLKLAGTIGGVGVRWAVLAIEGLVVAVFLASPKAFFPAFKAILVLSGRLGSLIFGLIATAVFFLILTPIALAMRLGRKTFMPIRPDPEVASYYDTGGGGHDYEKQF
jgi:hypothetical protein